ncbi:armadillo repeat-containing protein 8-like [Saccoglossus kowalevskii]|uniref:Armadillo repeat-containing protein 8 n=1 Tax=Saccoglossus kowalevskii TaxID=10224 RepID=A0ABM0GQC5_SACKO|nr:PREDICTED: armadillo repeat-containing protein 8-like [Saccoglossus kowalevskii]
MIESMILGEDVNPSQIIVDSLSTTDTQQLLLALRQMKNVVIGSNRQKSNMILCGAIPKLLYLQSEFSGNSEVLLESAVVLGSFAKGTCDNVKSLLDNGVIPILLKGLVHSDIKYIEACLRCLRTIFASDVTPSDYLYDDGAVVLHLISIIPMSLCTQECITSILSKCCKNRDHQNILSGHGAIQALAPLLTSNCAKVQLPTLQCYAMMCYQNEQVAMAIAAASYNSETIPQLLVKQCGREQNEMKQLTAAKCLAYLCRAGAIQSQNSIIVTKALPTLVRMCKNGKKFQERVEGAETLAYLIETDVELQRIASVSDHLVKTLADYFRWPPPGITNNTGDLNKLNQDMQYSSELKQAAFRAYASLGANDEDIRKRIIETENLMDHIVTGLSDSAIKVRIAAVRCLHSLSRSVQQLRTSFQDHAVWKPLMKLLQNASDEILTVASSTLCNLLLEFSPSKEPILESGAVELLCDLARREDPALRLNAIWALMNMSFQTDQKIKTSILANLGTEQIFQLLSDSNVDVLMKTLGLLRNLLSTKSHIDHIMCLHGTQIMQAVVLILEGEHSVEVKEQTLCIVANIADGCSAKEFIMSNDDVLKKITNYMIHANVKLQIAATYCVSNLVWNEEEGALERQAKLRDMGVQKLLQQLLSSSDTVLFDKVKTALQQFT